MAKVSHENNEVVSELFENDNKDHKNKQISDNSDDDCVVQLTENRLECLDDNKQEIFEDDDKLQELQNNTNRINELSITIGEQESQEVSNHDQMIVIQSANEGQTVDRQLDITSHNEQLQEINDTGQSPENTSD